MRETRKPKKNTGFLDALDEARECPARLEKLRAMHVNITSAGGNCPVQIQGHVKGRPFYFRARGEHWSLGIGREPIGNPDFYYEEPFGAWPEAGWMRLHEAYDFLIAGILRWRPMLAQAMSAGTAETQSGSGRQPASAVLEEDAPQ